MMPLPPSAPQSAPPKTPRMVWEAPVVVYDRDVFRDKGVVTAEGETSQRSQGRYGSEYPRLLHLKGGGRQGTWLAAYTFARNDGYQRDPKGGLELGVSRSRDGGRTWTPLAIVSEPGRDLDNAQLTLLRDGSLLLACRSVRWQESYRLPVYRSTDGGATWTRRGTIDAAEGRPGELGKPDKGMYEPHLGLLGDGRLAAFYASETHVAETPSYSQVISERVSRDGGRTWGPEIRVADRPGHGEARPGMPVWTRLRGGGYLVAYEVCGPESDGFGGCRVAAKTSPDGVTWARGLGAPVPEHLGAPYVVALPDGRLVLSSNAGHVSVSGDEGRGWARVEDAWPQSLWTSLALAPDGRVVAANSEDRPVGGHRIAIRFGRLAP